jgi:4-hydroxy-4-methyl-2-oxoglutarate aldolase
MTSYPTSDLCDALRQIRGRNAALAGVVRGGWRSTVSAPVLGPAYTMRVRRAPAPVDTAIEDWMRAFDEAPNGAFMVIEVVGDVGGAVIGAAAATRLAKRGGLGLIVDGPVRDWADISTCGIPSWVRETRVDGTAPPENVNETGTTVRLGGVDVAPGDIVAGDQDGVIVIPQAEWPRVREIADGITASEQQMFDLLAEGKSISEAYKITRRA